MVPAPTKGRITVSSFNVLNYFNGPSFPTTRGAKTALDFAKQRRKIISALTIMDAAVVGLMEIENDGYGPDSAIQDLVNGLNEATIAGKYNFVHPGREIVGTDEIAVKIIYQPDRVSPAGPPAILNETFDANFVTTFNRPSLAQSFRDALSGAVFTVVVNHLKSKGSACAGDPDLGDGAGNCNLVRKRAAGALGRWAWSDPTGSG
jgi:predicted extracellular nuclease